MSTHTHQRRLARLQARLHPPAAGYAARLVATFFHIPDLDHAVARAQKAGANSVVFVPENGGDVQFGACEQPANRTPTTVVAFEIPPPDRANPDCALAYCTERQLRQMAAIGEDVMSEVNVGEESTTVLFGDSGSILVNIPLEGMPC